MSKCYNMEAFIQYKSEALNSNNREGNDYSVAVTETP
jgi:hypothetical protein